MRAVLAFEHEVQGTDPTHWAETLGIDPSGRFVLYGYGVWPVMRIELTNPGRLRAVADRVATAAGPSVQRQALSGHTYWTVPLGKTAVVGAVLDHQAVLALVPSTSLPQVLPHLLDTQRPKASLRTSPVVPELMSRHRFGPMMIGYLDARKLVGVIESGGPLHDVLTAQLGAALTAPCRADVDRLVALAPRLAFGYERLDEQGMSARLVAETPPWLTAQLAKLQVAVPAVPTNGQPMLAVGAAVDVDALTAWLQGVVTNLHAHPFSCPALANLDKAFDDLGTSLAEPRPPMLQGLHGFSLVLDDASIMPPSGTGHLVVFGAHVKDLVDKASKLVPFLGALNIPSDGTPVPLPIGKLGMPNLPPVHIALHGDRLVLAMGTDSATRASRQLAVAAQGHAPLATFAYAPKRFAERFGMLLHDTDAMRNSSFESIAMVVEVADDGLSVGLSGAWAPLPAAPAQAQVIAH